MSKAVSRERTLSIKPELANLFALATGDNNPLHSDCDSAARGPFGRPTVFGALVMLAALRDVGSNPRAEIASARALFAAPVFWGQRYLLRTELTASAAHVRLMASSKPQMVMATTVAFTEARDTASDIPRNETLPVAPPAHYHPKRMAYVPNLELLHDARCRLDLPCRVASDLFISLLAFCSYLMGTRLTSYGAIFGLGVELHAERANATQLSFDVDVTRVVGGGAVIDVNAYCGLEALAGARIRTRAINPPSCSAP